jgi:serine/threonine protein kinase
MGRVYLAYTPGGRPVALKIVRPEFGADADFRERFRREVGAARRVHGLYTAQVLDADPDATPPWLVTAYVPGPSLQEAVKQHGPMPPSSVFSLMAGVAEALAAIHAAGVVHRDLKPSNVLLAPDGPRVIDFGIAQAVDESALTRLGMRVGSPQFMAPEQIQGQLPTPSVDMFALGHLAAYAALGRSPFGTGDPAVVFPRILHQPADLGDCAPPLRTLIERCLSKDPQARPTPADVIAACREYQSPQTVQVIGTWLPPSMAAAVAGHLAPPAPTLPPSPYAYGPTAPTGTLSRLSRASMTRAVTAVAIIGAVAGVSIVLLHDRNNGGTPTSQHSSSTSTSATAVTSAHAAAAATTPTPAPSPTSGLDPCVIGTWAPVSEDVTNTINGNPVQFSGLGPNETYRSDGTLIADYGSSTGSVFTANAGGESWEEIVRGTATAQYETRNGTLLDSDIRPVGTWTLYENGVYNNSGALTVETAPTPYTCTQNTLKIYPPNGSLVLDRTSP